MLRYELINLIIATHGYRRYLEIGIAQGVCFEAVVCAHKAGVDIAGSPTYLMTSDEFFAGTHEPYDLIFVDGSHTTAQAARDIDAALRLLTEEGTLVAHDCNPTSEEMAVDEYRGGCWMGGVWKTIARLRATPGLSVRTVDTDCGVAVIRRGEQEPYELPVELAYAELDGDRVRMLNLVSVAEFAAAP